MITCREERFADYIDELRPLTAEHYAEVGRCGPAFGEAIDFDLYREYDERGFLVSVIARSSGEIVGYWGGILHADPHSSIRGNRATMLSQSVIWIMPCWRARTALPLIRSVERVAAERGVSVLSMTSRSDSNNRAGAFFSALGYRTAEVTHIKLIGEAADA